ncbi:MAG: alpha-L-fucosidase, partial [Clostridia bacterium]|nr:alpha-L-fucosidase [Clostridia bacterium]
AMELKQALEGTGVRFGVYHSLYEWDHPLYVQDPERFTVEHLLPMMKELIEKYQPATLFTDGEWEHPSSVWHAEEFLQWLYNESSVRDFIVPNDRWGRETRGRLGGNFTSEYGVVTDGKTVQDIELDRPFEECRGIGGSFGYNRNEELADYLGPKELLVMLCDLVSKGGNLLLNIGPNGDGTIPVIMEERLLQIGDWLRVNGEAIYCSRVYSKAQQKGVYYTRREDAVYAILDRFPFGSQLLELVDYDPGWRAQILGSDAKSEIREEGGKVRLIFPPIDPETVDSSWLYTVKLTKEE